MLVDLKQLSYSFATTIKPAILPSKTFHAVLNNKCLQNIMSDSYVKILFKQTKKLYKSHPEGLM